METVPLARRPASCDLGLNNGYSMGSRADSNISSPRIAPSLSMAEVRENKNPPELPKGFESMLRTTTETGDIGLFSIKSPRVSQIPTTPRRVSGKHHGNVIQKPPKAFQPYGVPSVDDRKRLPSYARDASSEVISMYETASQKSASRVFEDPDYRSYSMTQTSSFSSYTLSNHKSYASLRSQPDGNMLVQRPRSPFAYPTRLKRPGFRPSSPALTDGGGVDYSRRAEIDRISHVSSSFQSSRLVQPLVNLV